MLTDEKFTELVESHMNMVYRLALSYLKEPTAAEDAAQEVFLRLYRRAPEFENAEHARHWLVRVTINECKRLAASAWKNVSALEEGFFKEDAPDGKGQEIYELVMTLPVKYRVVLHLHYYEGYSTGEIAAMLKRPAATVRSQLERGRKLLKKELLEAENV